MKKITLVSILLLVHTILFGQDPDPQIFDTWHLNKFQQTDLNNLFIISDIEPEISPTLTINSNLEFQGEGACNTFNGLYEFTAPNTLTALEFNGTDADCGFNIQNSFEQDYFPYIQGMFYYSIETTNEGLKLSLNTPLFGIAEYTNYILSVTENELANHIKVYPNPTTEQLIVSTENIRIQMLRVYSNTGQKIIEQATFNNSIDVSALSRGIYFLEIESEQGKAIKEFIKN